MQRKEYDNQVVSRFQKNILSWYKTHHRSELPWRWTEERRVEPYHILVSEVMLQQTQVPRVLVKFPEFINRFPTVHHLAEAPLPAVLSVWQGMGYNRRGVYLKRCAEAIVKEFDGIIPDDAALLRTLPGIGPYTAGAVACFAYNRPVPFIDTNIRKVFIHHFFPRKRGKIDDRDILAIAHAALDRKNPRLWNYALMDYGALELNRNPDLLKKAKSYTKQSKFEGSARYYRAQIVKYLLDHGSAAEETLQKLSPLAAAPLLASLCRDGLIKEKQKGIYYIPKS